MRLPAQQWDYLIVTASNAAQAQAYEEQLRGRRALGLLAGVREAIVVADPPGQRLGSGGSTVLCLWEILRRRDAGGDLLATLSQLRILIVHAGGDSRRLPAYGPCGKIFIPVPGESDSAVGATLFDRQLPLYLAMPAPDGDFAGQIVITAGDVLLSFDPSLVLFAPLGLTGLGTQATPEQASRHGVYCPAADSRVKLYLQKPSPSEQQARGAIDRYGQSVLDIGVIAFDAATATALLRACGSTTGKAWSGETGRAIETYGLDFYREICCAIGSEVTFAHHAAEARSAGSKWDDAILRTLYDALHNIPFAVRALPHCGFLHFGSTREIIESGLELVRQDRGRAVSRTLLSINNDIAQGVSVAGSHGWVEGCRIRGALFLGGQNVLVGVDTDAPLTLPPGACIDLTHGHDSEGRPCTFVRCYGADDGFKDSPAQGATFCNLPMDRWLAAAGAETADLWPRQLPQSQRSLWNARVFPAAAHPSAFRDWLWMFNPAEATAAQKAQWLAADRYSSEKIAAQADQTAFHERRLSLREIEVERSLRKLFRLRSGFSARDLAHMLEHGEAPARLLAGVMSEACWNRRDDTAAVDAFTFSRIIHSLASAVSLLEERRPGIFQQLGREAIQLLGEAEVKSLSESGLLPTDSVSAPDWAARAHAAAFDHLSRTIVSSGARGGDPPRHALRADEIVWGRAPARLDLGGGWTDTPPYALEHGGAVINAAVNLNGQPPIHCYGRVIPEPVIRIGSIDVGTRIEISTLDSLIDYTRPGSEFGLAKAALALSAFSPRDGGRPRDPHLQQMLEAFGGGIELTTLAAVPKGSGLGTSSIMGAVIFSVVQRMIGRRLTPAELFHGVLRLEQALTSGGGWQDQVGGVAGGVKVITTSPGLLPDARLHYVPSDVLDPQTNGGRTLLYYTGLTRMARNILHQVVGRYLDRDRSAMATLRQLRALPPLVADAMSRKDLEAFGALIDTAWRLNKELDPNSTTPQIEAILESVRPHLLGAKLLGAGGGGFLLMVCRSPKAAAAVRRTLESQPPNDRARFFRFGISRTALRVNVC